jgi:hypothetical protein
VSGSQELETHIQAVIEMAGNVVVVEECLNHFESNESQYPLVGREYCINVLKDAKVRLNNTNPDRVDPALKIDESTPDPVPIDPALENIDSPTGSLD